MASISLMHILFSFAIGLWGRNYRFGFWGYFFATLLFTPVIGTLMVIASIPAPSGDTRCKN